MTDVAETDVRAARPYVLSRGPLAGLARRGLSVLTLAVLDVLGLALGIYAALVLRALVYRENVFWNVLWSIEREWLGFLAPVMVLVFLQAGLYSPRERRAGAGRVLAGLITLALVVLALGLGTSFEVNTTGLIPTAVVTSAIAVGVLRTAYESAALEAMKLLGVRRRLLLVGEPNNVERIVRQLASARGGLAYDIAAVVAPSEVCLRPGGVSGLREILGETRPHELIVDEGAFDERSMLALVEQSHRAGIRVRLVPNTTELLVHEGRYVPGQGAPLFELRPPVLTGVDWMLKRAFDLIVSALLVVALVPLWLVVALLVRLESRGPLLYVDRRVGVGEREFGMLKIRTMVAGAAAQQAELEALNEAEGALFKIRDDPRLTRVGRVLRRLSIDELPQLVNVLRGEMSLVGPRPLPLRDHAMLEDWHRSRNNVLPGMTGLWQISGRSGLSFDDLVRLDFTYLENWSIWLDVSIILKTIPAVLGQARGVLITLARRRRGSCCGPLQYGRRRARQSVRGSSTRQSVSDPRTGECHSSATLCACNLAIAWPESANRESVIT